MSSDPPAPFAHDGDYFHVEPAMRLGGGSPLDLAAIAERLAAWGMVLDTRREESRRDLVALLVHVRALRAALVESHEQIEHARAALRRAATAPTFDQILGAVHEAAKFLASGCSERAAAVLRGAQDPEG